MKNWWASISSDADVMGVFAQTDTAVSGYALGIITVDLGYPKVPGNVANPTSFPFPVVYESVHFEIEQLFAGDPAIQAMIVEAARKLEAQGVRAIVGACGYFAHFQQDVAAAVDVPVFMSSLLQLPLITAGLKPNQSILVMAADGESINEQLLTKVNATHCPIVVANVGDLETFAAIRWSRGPLDNAALARDLCDIARSFCTEHPNIAAILLECSDLPPYAWAIQAATNLPVYDFQTLIKWVYAAVVQKPYRGFC